MANQIAVGILGDYNKANSTHIATSDSLQHAAASLGVAIQSTWLPTDGNHNFAGFQALFCSPGSPYASLEGALRGILYARENSVPFLGTCGGLQHLVLEFARNVMGFHDAAHAESDPYASRLCVTPLTCSLVGKRMQVEIKSGSKAAAIYQAPNIEEDYYCNFGINPSYQQALQDAGLAVTGTDSNGEIRILELPTHPFFLGTLFVPQARSRPEAPHPVVLAFCRAAADLL